MGPLIECFVPRSAAPAVELVDVQAIDVDDQIVVFVDVVIQ